jgi:uncharacterized spore protein YtfJ
MQDLKELTERARDAISVERVFGAPYEKNGITVLPAARIQGGGGGGTGEGPDGEGKGSGGGFGLGGKPAGVYVIRDDDVQWRPAVDVNRMILGGQIVAIVALLTLRSIIKYRSRRPAEAA